jgi:hypothetical protein
VTEDEGTMNLLYWFSAYTGISRGCFHKCVLFIIDTRGSQVTCIPEILNPISGEGVVASLALQITKTRQNEVKGVKWIGPVSAHDENR